MRIAVTILIAISALAWAEPASVHLERTTVEDLVRRLRNDGFRIHFERRLSRPEDALSLKKRIETIDAIPADERTPKEKQLHAALLKMRKEMGLPEEIIVSWRLTRFDFDYPGKVVDVSAVLAAIVRRNPEYSWKKVSESYLVYPLKGTFNKRIESVVLHDADRDEAFRVIRSTVLSPCGLSEMSTHIGPGPALREKLKDKRFSLTCQGEDAHTILTRFAELLGPRIVWGVLGTKEARNFGFSNISGRKKK